MNNTKVCIIGAGIIGITTAYRIKEIYTEVDVTIVAKSFSPNTLTDVAAGFWEPFLPGDTNTELIYRWSKETFDKMYEFMNTIPESGKIGLMTKFGYNLSETENKQPPYWKDIPYDFRMLTKRELSRFPGEIKSGFGFTTVFIEGPKFIPWLSKRIVEKGGKIVKKTVNSLSELYQSYDVIINCAGLGAKQLAHDEQIYPIRGQIVRVKAPWVSEFIINADGKNGRNVYILPNQDFVVLGGTEYRNNWNENPTEDDRQHILQSTKRLLPSLAGAEFLEDWVGLRPVRKSMRVEREDIKYGKNNEKTAKVIHNYGHGGSGLTVCWGCAGDAVKLLTDVMNEIKKSKL